MTEIPRVERVAWLALLAAATVARLWDLGERPYHHDESQIAYFSWRFAEEGEYEYDPLLHSPLQYYLSALTFKVLGDTDFTARLPAVAAGLLAVGLAFYLRGFLGRLGAYAAGVALAFGPSFLYYGRFMREDILLVCANLALLVVLSYFLAAPRRWHPAALGALLAVAFGIKEATFITVGVAGPFFVLWLALAWRRARRDGLSLRDHPLVAAVRGVGWEAWGWGLAAFLAVSTLIFTTFLTDPQHWDWAYEGLDYWRDQHGAGRGEKERYFYSVVLAGHEWPALALGAVGAVALLRRRSPFGAFLVWLFAGQLLAYSIANERFTWLVLHPLLPLTLLAGAGAQVIWNARARWSGRLGLLLVAVSVAYAGYASWLANAEHGADPVEFLVTTQTAHDVRGVVDEVLALDRELQREEGRPARVTIDTDSFPHAWYFRDLEAIGYVDLAKADQPPDADVIVMTDANRLRLQDRLGDFRARRFHFRVWWVRDYSEMTAGSFLDWMLTRDTWNPTGGLDAWLLVRKGL
jgi:uncharacterized protein (TIGR03663 family)